ncbi:MAG: MYXO-CTERM sorting domain-containing protein, partial [Polyangiaceae bacterium]
NVASVSSALIRGRADSSLAAAGGGCGSCKVGATGDSSSSLAPLFAGLALLFVRRKKTASHR